MSAKPVTSGGEIRLDARGYARRNVIAIVLTFAFFAALSFITSWFDNTPKFSAVPDDKDRQVMEALLLYAHHDSEFNFTGVRTNGATIVLDSRTPGGNRTLRPDMMWRPDDIGPGHSVPEDIQRDIVRRNGKQPASFTGWRVDSRIIVATIPRSTGRSPPGLFQQAYPNGLAWVQAWLPGYARDGTRAVVRAWVGPRPGGAQLTAYLEKDGEVWSVKWHYLDCFQRRS